MRCKIHRHRIPAKIPDLNVGEDIQVDCDRFIIAEPGSAWQFLSKHNCTRFCCNRFNYQKDDRTKRRLALKKSYFIWGFEKVDWVFNHRMNFFKSPCLDPFHESAAIRHYKLG